MSFYAVRNQFPILEQKVGRHSLVYLDNAATTQKPHLVIDAIVNYYRQVNGNINRGVHQLARSSEFVVEKIRAKVAKWIHAYSPNEIVFTPGTTASINCVMYGYGENHIEEGDEILVSAMEHTSNWLPWRMLAERKGGILKKIPLTLSGDLDMDAYAKLLGSRTKIVAITHVSNVLGVVNPIHEITRLAHEHGAVVVVDAAQSIAHLPINVQTLACDFLAFSSHKMYGPTGLGVLYIRKKMMDAMLPYQLGGGIVRNITSKKIVYERGPQVFEAGTLHLAGIAGLGAAFTFMQHLTSPYIQSYESSLLEYAIEQLQMIPGLKIWGDFSERAGIISFTIEGLHSLDIGIKLDALGIAVRTGKHCAHTLMKDFGVEGMVRVSLAIYNTQEDIDRLIEALHITIKTL